MSHSRGRCSTEASAWLSAHFVFADLLVAGIDSYAAQLTADALGDGIELPLEHAITEVLQLLSRIVQEHIATADVPSAAIWAATQILAEDEDDDYGWMQEDYIEKFGRPDMSMSAVDNDTPSATQHDPACHSQYRGRLQDEYDIYLANAQGLDLPIKSFDEWLES